MNHSDIASEFFKAANFSGVLITDENGTIIHVDDNFESMYDLDLEQLTGSSVYELERRGYFKPSAAVMVLKTRKEVTLIQTLRGGKQAIVSAFPIFRQDGTIEKAVTFTRNMDEHIKIKNIYEEMTIKIRQYEKILESHSEKSTIIENFFTNNGQFQQTLKALQSTARYNINILLLGETGVGKTSIAKEIHELSNYNKGEFVEVNCGALPGNLIESELFGYEKGSFTGADANGKKGLFEIANGGTLFLDEVSELPLMAQVKLLKVLQNSEFRHIGGSKNIKTDCRIIAATNKDLNEEIREGRFRQDLYYRLNTVMFTLPPLRERKEDIIALCSTLMDKANQRFGFEKTLAREVIDLFLKYDWPGNVRELENAIFRMAVTSDDKIIATSYIPEEILQSTAKYFSNKKTSIYPVSDLTAAMEQFEGELIRTAYLEHGTSIKMAQALNISQATAARKIRKYVAK